MGGFPLPKFDHDVFPPLFINDCRLFIDAELAESKRLSRRFPGYPHAAQPLFLCPGPQADLQHRVDGVGQRRVGAQVGEGQ
ncbi:hypothetical protein DK853_40410, partial [Klebsiella oxytoca]